MTRDGLQVTFRLIILVAIGVLIIGLSACGQDGSPPDGGEGTGDGEGDTTTLASVGLVVGQDSINPGDETTITAIAYDEQGKVLSDQDIEFRLDDPTMGSITADGSTGGEGTFEATFQARESTGQVNVTAFSEGVTSEAKEITIKNQSGSVNVSLSANPTTITATNTSTISATVTNTEDGSAVANGTRVTFSVEDSAFGTITESATTNAGKATATFRAADFAGTTTINASSGSAKASVDITIEPVAAASIEFDSVTNNPLAIRGTGGEESANVSFNVRDVNGNPAEDIDVVFTMDSGVQGAEYLEEDDDTPYTQSVGTSEGSADITLHSGYEAGTVSITATIATSSGNTISATTPVISIGGGVPTDDWFTVSVQEEPGWNMGGLACVGIETPITAWLADRYGNYNVLDGHNVFFEAEVGLAAKPTGVTEGATGTANSVVRTQSANGGAPKDVVPEEWEVDLKDELRAVYGRKKNGHPRDGVCSVLVFTKGEESFVDGSNDGAVNGRYDEGEDFVDTADDPWRDYDDDGDWDDGSETTPGPPDSPASVSQDPVSGITANPEEDGYQDSAGNNKWDGKNGAWDGNKNLFRQVDFLITGKPTVWFSKGSFNVENGDSDTVKILICDPNYNPLSTGSSYTVSVDVGKITGGTKEFEYPSSSFYGSETTTDLNGDGKVDKADYVMAHRNLIENVIVISDEDAEDGEAAEPATLTVEVTWKSNGDCGDETDEYTISGMVD